MAYDSEVFYIWLSLACGIKSGAYHRLFSSFGTAKEIYELSDYSEFELSARASAALEDKELDKAFEIYKRCKADGIGIVTFEDELFPEQLRVIAAPPPLLYYKGTLRNLDDELCISFVGSRKASEYGKKMAHDLAFDVARSGAVVVSGVAEGIDAESHKGALAAGGYTVGFAGTSIDSFYPKCNAALFREIYEKGVVLSEYYPGCQTTKYAYPMRNRLISGVSLATVVVEAGETSGSLITADYAFGQGKTVFAVPANVGVSPGTNRLIKNGAELAQSAGDILDGFAYLFSDKVNVVPGSSAGLNEAKGCHIAETDIFGEGEIYFDDVALSEDEERVMEIIGNHAPVTADEVIIYTNKPAKDIMVTLTELELKGFITAKAGGRYVPKGRNE